MNVASDEYDISNLQGLLIEPVCHITLSDPFSTNVPLLYPLKTSDNLWFSGAFRGYRSEKMD